jgi:DNA-binding MarR family transcriptional regulator
MNTATRSRLQKRPAAKTKRREASAAINDSVNPKSAGPRLGRLLHDVARLRRRAFNILSAPVGLTRTQYWLLAFIARTGSGLTQSQIALELNIGKVAVGSTIDRLVERDLVQRGTDAADRRVKPLAVTIKGHKALESMQTVRPIIDELVFRGMSAESRAALIEGLSRVRINLVSMLERPRPPATPEPKIRRRAVRQPKTPRDLMFTSFG